MPRVGNGDDFDECWCYPVDNKVVGMNNEFSRAGDASRTIEVGTGRKIGYRAVNRPVKITSPDAEFASAEEAEAYDQWLRAKIAASLADSRPAIPHHIAMAQLRAVIDRQPDQDASDPVAP